MPHPEVLAARPDDHGDLLERAVARPLADPVHRDLDLACSVLDTGERVRHREPEVVVAVGGDDDVIGHGVPNDAHELTELARRGVPDRVGDVDGGGAALDREPEAREQEVELGPRGVLGAELHVVGVALRERDVLADRVQHLLVRHLQHGAHLDVARGDERVDAPALGALQRLRRTFDVTRGGPRERGDHRAMDGIGDLADRLELAR